jgi:hypothetical protein
VQNFFSETGSHVRAVPNSQCSSTGFVVNSQLLQFSTAASPSLGYEHWTSGGIATLIIFLVGIRLLRALLKQMSEPAEDRSERRPKVKSARSASPEAGLLRLPLISGLETCKSSPLPSPLSGKAEGASGLELRAEEHVHCGRESKHVNVDHVQPAPRARSSKSGIPHGVPGVASTPATPKLSTHGSAQSADEPRTESSGDDCESLAFVRQIVVLGLKSARQRGRNSQQRSQAVELAFKGGSYEVPVALLPRSASVEGHEWAFSDIRSCILQTAEELPESMQPRCYLLHVWRANFTTCLRQICSSDALICSTAARYGWQLSKRGYCSFQRICVCVSPCKLHRHLGPPHFTLHSVMNIFFFCSKRLLRSVLSLSGSIFFFFFFTPHRSFLDCGVLCA